MIDILYVAYNRLEFTRYSFDHLLTNTNWDHVNRLCVYDDGSEDGTREWLGENVGRAPVETILRAEGGIGPVGIMLRHIYDEVPTAPLFAKIDNDVVVPPGWLDAMLGVLDHRPSTELLGMEAGMTPPPGQDGAEWDGRYDFERASNIGGVGLMRLSAFHCRTRMKANGRFGFSEWQHTYRPSRGWIDPSLPVVLLDRLPFEPWLSLSREYVAHGWQRPWHPWDPKWMAWAWEWLVDGEEQVA